MRQNSPEAFQQQLLEGHLNELRVALYFMLRNYHVKIGFDGARFDLSVIDASHLRRQVEVKWDKRCQDSGNLYFEVENTRQRKPSGVFASEADWWCHVLGDGNEGILVRTDLLRKFLAEGDFRQVQTRGVDSNSRGTLVPLVALQGQSQFHRLQLPTVEGYFATLLEKSLPGRKR